MIKILQFIHGLNMGGAETLVKEYVLGLDKQKFNITVLCQERLNTPWEKKLSDAGIRVIYMSDEIPMYGRKNFLAKSINILMKFWLSRKYIRLIEPDIIHEHLVLSQFLRFAKPKKETKIFYTQHFQVDRLKKNFPKDIEATKWLIKHYDMRIIALNYDMKEELENLFNHNNIYVLNNGINIKRFIEVKEKDIVRKEIGIPQNAFVIGHVGRFDPVKNHDFLVKIYDEVKKQKKDAFLLMVGQGHTKETVWKYLQELHLEKESIILSDRTDIPDLMHAMDIMVLTSISEGMPVTLIEAQIARLDCLVADCVPEAIQISNLVEFCSLNEEPAVWAKKIINFEKKEPIYNEVDKWDIIKIIIELEKLYEESMQQNSR